MTNNLLGDITSSLKQEEERLSAELNELKKKAKLVELDLKRIRDARSALGAGRKSANSKRKPAPTADDVKKAVNKALVADGPLEEPVIRERVERELADEGKSKMGLSLRMKEVLNSMDFVESSGRWQLADEPTNPVAEAALSQSNGQY